MLGLLHSFEEATTFGSLIQPCLNEQNIAFARRAIEAKDLGGQLFLRETHTKALRALEQAEMLCRQYHVVVANPPFMGGKGMNPRLKKILQDHYSDAKSDLFAAFSIQTDRGWKISVDRGLDIFQRYDMNALSLAAADQTERLTKGCEITFLLEQAEK